MKNKKTMLITGGCGFVGTNAALYFAKRGWDIIVLDNLSRGGSEINAQLLQKKTNNNGKIEVVVGHNIDSDRDFHSLKSFVLDGVDVILHTAAQVAVTSSVANPIRDFEVNARGTLNILEAARLARKKPIVIFTSTNKVYGGMEDVELIEKKTRYLYKDKPFGISEKQSLDFHSPYGCSKGSADQYVRDYYRIYGVPTIVFRQSCIYGFHQFGIVDQGWVSFLMASVFFGKPITIYGNGKQVRDILFGDDLNRAFDLAIKHIKKTKGQIYNIGGGFKNSISVLEFVSMLGELFSKKIEVNFNDWRPGDQRVYISDIRKAKKDFGWEPKISFKEGLDLMYKWIKKDEKMLKNFI